MARTPTVVSKRRRRAEPAPTTPDPIEIAMEAEARDNSPGSPARTLLVNQNRLVRWQIASERAGVALKVLTGLAGLAVVGGLAWALWDASQASGAVIEPFDSAPALEAQGLTGPSIANELLGRVLAMQTIVPLDRAFQRSTSTAGQINVVIPQTGVSVGEAQRLLRAWLGHQAHVSGALRPAMNGRLELVLRIDGRQVEVTPPPPDLSGSADAWLASAAEAAMRETDPYRYGVWLAQFDGRQAEAEAAMRRLTRTGTAIERAWAWTSLGTYHRARGNMTEALEAFRVSQSLNPRLDTAAQGLSYVYRLLGRDELARAYAAEALRVAGTGDPIRVAVRRAVAAAAENDWLGTVEATDTVTAAIRWGQSAPPGLNWSRDRATANLAQALTRLHEPRAARAAFGDLDPLASESSLSAMAEDLAAAGRWADLDTALTRPWRPRRTIESGQEPTWDRTVRWPWQAYVAARLGRIEAARVLVEQTPADCYLCIRMRGKIAELAGQRAEADRWFADAARQGPSLADAEQAWGEAKLVRGDAVGALALAKTAAKKAPRWADPKKLAADALMRTGDAKAAAETYAVAAALAPRWGALHLAWGEALAKLGEADEARVKWRAAAGMDLNPADRARVTALLNRGRAA